jgi:hypothetical protein
LLLLPWRFVSNNFQIWILFFVSYFPSFLREILIALTAAKEKERKEGAALPFFISTFLGLVKPTKKSTK